MPDGGKDFHNRKSGLLGGDPTKGQMSANILHGRSKDAKEALSDETAQKTMWKVPSEINGHVYFVLW